MKSKNSILKRGYSVFTLLFFSACMLLQSVGHAQTVTTFAGTGTAGFSGDGGPATAAKFANNSPVGVAVDATGNVYVTDDNNNRIRKINTSDTISTFIGTNAENYTGDGGQYTNATIAVPYAVAIDTAGVIYIATDNVIRKISTSGIITTLAGNVATCQNYTASNENNGSLATAASFAEVTNVAVDDSGNVYIVDQNANTILKVNKVTSIISIVAGGGSGSDGGLATNAALSSPKAVAVDAAENIFITDYGHNSVRKVTASTGIISTVASVTSATSLAFDNAGNLYISSPYNSIKKLDTAGNLTTWLSYTSYSSGLAIDHNNNLYIADQVAKKVIKVLPPCTSVAAGSISNLTGNSICTSGSSSLSLTGESAVNAITYQWQSSTNGVTWTNVGADNTTYNTGTITATTYYRNIVTCTSASLYDTTQVDTITVSTPVAPTVSITSGSGSSICVGTNVTFTATSTDSGTSPSYQWKKNGIVVGTTDNTYTDNTLVNNDVISCTLTSNATCVTTNTATSNTITISVTGNVTPTVSISSGVGNTICSGTSVTFTAMANGGGSNPAFQWTKNSVPVGSNIATYTDNTLNDQDTIACVLTTNATCATNNTANSNALIITVNPTVTPTVSISPNASDTICIGAPVTFTATTANSGTNPSYQWTKNGTTIAGETNTTYTDNGLNNNDVIACVVTGNTTCATSNIATSNAVTMTVNPISTPTISISANHNSVCMVTAITFTAATTYGGTAPAYQWMDNGTAIAGATDAAYSSSGNINNNDQISCTLISNSTAPCAATNTATSNTLTMTILSSAAPVVSISTPFGDTGCIGAPVTFTANATNTSIPTSSFSWYKNGSNVYTTSGNNTYTDNNINTGDAIYCKVTSSSLCNPFGISDTMTMTMIQPVFPTVTITNSNNDTICAGATTSFTATTTGGGTAPSFQWSINSAGVSVTTDSTYSNNLLNNNNWVAVTMTSSATCAIPATVSSNTVTMTVNQFVTPTVSINANPGDTICAGAFITFTATSVNGGTGPSYQWTNNGIAVGNSDNTYTDSSLNNNDVVICILTSNAACTTTDTATSNDITLTVNPIVAPAVSISASPDTTITSGETVTFTATVTNGGTAPTYQWQDNGVDISGATAGTYTSSTLANSDIITCVVTSDAVCATPNNANSNHLTIHISSGVASVTAGINNIRLYPNPNNGTFSIEGTVNDNSEEAQIEVLNVVGQVIYNTTAAVQNRKINTQLTLADKNANGAYLLRIKTGNGSDVIRFVMER